mgnify:CR=1 FL=1
MLTIIGAGLYRSQLTHEAEDAIKSADIVYVETYTSPKSSWIVETARQLNSNVRVSDRHLLEDMSREVIELARTNNVAIVTPGDPMIATTHSSLVVEAKTRGIDVRLINGVSGPCSVVSVSGLHFYKFGRTVTIPGKWRGVGARYVVEGLLGNLCMGMHTLLLLDVDERGNTLSPHDAAASLVKEFSAHFDPHLINDLLILLISLNEVGPVTYYTTAGGLQAHPLPQVDVGSLVVPAALHVSEREFLHYMYGVPAELLEAHNLAVRKLSPCDLYRAIASEGS